MVAPRILLAFTLLLTATHCVEIDDRELEEHGPGGGPGACEIDSSLNECGVCVRQNCCTQFANCVENSDCVNLSDCIYSCGNTTDCVDYCVEQYPGGASPFADYLTCSTDLCQFECV